MVKELGCLPSGGNKVLSNYHQGSGGQEEAVRLLKKLGVALTRATDGHEGKVVNYLFGRLSILLQKDNSTFLIIYYTTLQVLFSGF